MDTEERTACKEANAPAGALQDAPAPQGAPDPEPVGAEAPQRRTSRPEGYVFGGKVAERIEGAQLSGDNEEREAEQAAEARMRKAAHPVDWKEKLAAMSDDERLEATVECLGRRPSFRRILRSVLELCLEERDSAEVEEYIETFPEFATNRQSARRYMFFLLRTGALQETAFDADGNVVDESVVEVEHASEPAADADVPDEAVEPAEEAAAPDDGAVQPETPASAEAPAEPVAPADAAQVEDAGASADAPDAAQADGGEPEPGEAAATPGEAVSWRTITTEIGQRALEESSPLAKLHALFASEPESRHPTYRKILEFCQERRMLGQISDMLAGDPGLEVDERGIVRMQPNAYIGKLDEAGGLTWDNGWITTEEGAEVIDTL